MPETLLYGFSQTSLYKHLLREGYVLLEGMDKLKRNHVRSVLRKVAGQGGVSIRSADDQYREIALMVVNGHILLAGVKDYILSRTGYHVCDQAVPPMDSRITRVDTPFCAYCGTRCSSVSTP